MKTKKRQLNFRLVDWFGFYGAWPRCARRKTKSKNNIKSLKAFLKEYK